MTNKSSSDSIAIIGGSGLYALPGLELVKEHSLETPYGKPSSPIAEGRLSQARILFLARHGKGHTILPSEVNSRANIYALKELGATWCIGVSAVGSLKEDIHPGDIVLPDQIIDRTIKREQTFFGHGIVAHVSFAEPFCPVLRQTLLQSGSKVLAGSKASLHNGGIYVCMEGPAFSTRAESHFHRSLGAALIGMTAVPEAKLAREAELAYATLALATDYDCWKEDEHVDVAMVLETMKHNAENACKIIADTCKKLPELTPSPLASEALKCAIMSDLKQTSAENIQRLKPILQKYLT